MHSLLAKQLRDSCLPADVLAGKLHKAMSFALRRGTIALVSTQALDGSTGYDLPGALSRMSSPYLSSSPLTTRLDIHESEGA